MTSYLSEKLGLPQDQESQDKRRNRIFKPLAGVAGLVLAVSGFNFATTPKVIDQDHAVIGGKADAAKAVCDTVDELAERNGIEARQEECMRDMGRITLQTGQVVDVAITRTPIANIGGGNLGFNVPGVKTSVDKQIENARQNRDR